VADTPEQKTYHWFLTDEGAVVVAELWEFGDQRGYTAIDHLISAEYSRPEDWPLPTSCEIAKKLASGAFSEIGTTNDRLPRPGLDPDEPQSPQPS
jgi:hypothetical protein